MYPFLVDLLVDNDWPLAGAVQSIVELSFFLKMSSGSFALSFVPPPLFFPQLLFAHFFVLGENYTRQPAACRPRAWRDDDRCKLLIFLEAVGFF